MPDSPAYEIFFSILNLKLDTELQPNNVQIIGFFVIFLILLCRYVGLIG